MSDKIFLGRMVEDFDTSPALSNYSRVTINIGHDADGKIVCYTAGDDTGLEMVIDCPWGTQAMANALKTSLAGVRYQPFKVYGAYLNPAAEMGDGITVGGVYGGLYKRQIEFDAEPLTDLEAPMPEEIDQEYQFEDPGNREIERKVVEAERRIEATIDVKFESITLSVSDGTEANTSKIVLTAGGIEAVSDNITIKANSINLSTCTVTGQLAAGHIAANSITATEILAGSVTTEKLATNAITSQGYQDAYTIVYDGDDGLDHDDGPFNIYFDGQWHTIDGVPCGQTYGSGYVVTTSGQLKCYVYDLSDGQIVNEVPISTGKTGNDTLELSKKYGFNLKGTRLDLANGEFKSESMMINGDAAMFRGRLQGAYAASSNSYAIYSGSGYLSSFNPKKYAKEYAPVSQTFEYSDAEGDEGESGWYDEGGNLVYMNIIGIEVDGEDVGDRVFVTYEAVDSPVATIQDIKNLAAKLGLSDYNP